MNYQVFGIWFHLRIDENGLNLLRDVKREIDSIEKEESGEQILQTITQINSIQKSLSDEEDESNDVLEHLEYIGDNMSKSYQSNKANYTSQDNGINCLFV